MQNTLDLALAAPEILLLCAAALVLLIDAFSSSKERHLTFLLTLGALAAVTALSLWQWNAGVEGRAFHGLYVADSLSHLLKIASYLAVATALIYGRDYSENRDMLANGGEVYTLSLMTLLGQMVMISAGNMLTVYLGVELMSFSLYALVALRREHSVATEAAMKYFVLGSLASGILLYGMSMIYGATGQLDLVQIAQIIGSGQSERLPLVFGVVFIVAGFAFKLGAVPFHMWVPDVYHGSPTSVTLILGSSPYLAVLAVTLRLLVEGLQGIAVDWQPMLLIAAILSLAVGNIIAIAQTNFKRMLAYSMISHMGYVLLGLVSGMSGDPQATNLAYGSAVFYLLIYVLTTLVTFGLVLLLSRKGYESDEIADLKGLNRRNPVLAAILLLSMFSLAGIPPLVGFYSKLAVLQALVGAGHVLAAVLAVMFSLIGAFFYLRVVKYAYFDEPERELPPETAPGLVPTALMSVNGLLLIVLGVAPGGLMAACVQAIQNSLGF